MGGLGPERLSHLVMLQTCSLRLVFESVLETQTAHLGPRSIWSKPKEVKGNWVLKLPVLVSLVCWGNLGAS